MSLMLAGCAQTVITPPAGTPLAGFVARARGALGIHDDLYARALVLEETGQRIAAVVCDLCGLDAAFVAAVRQRVQEWTRIPPAAVLVAATHSHAAPATYALGSAPPDASWLNWLVDLVAEAVAGAVRDLAPARLAVGFGRETSVGRNRRRSDGPADPTVTVLRADRAGTRSALLVHYACHPTVLGPENLLISRDYVGFVVDAVERASGGWAMFANGACGDINVGHSADESAQGLSTPGRTFVRAEELGHRLAREAIRASAEVRPVSGSPKARHRFLPVSLRPTPPAAEMRAQVLARRRHQQALQAAGADEEALRAAQLELLFAELGLRWIEERGDSSTVTAEVQAFAVGEIAVVALPGEFFAESGLRLRERSPFPHTVVIGYANGGIGYVPPASAYAEGGYETRLAHWSKVGPEAEMIILDAAVRLLDDLKAASG